MKVKCKKTAVFNEDLSMTLFTDGEEYLIETITPENTYGDRELIVKNDLGSSHYLNTGTDFFLCHFYPLKDTKKEFFFTFGLGQIPGAGYFCRVSASSIEEATEIMHGRTKKYAFSYNSAEAAGVEKYELKECFWDEVFKGWQDYE